MLRSTPLTAISAAELQKAGADFAVITTATVASALLDEKLGFVLILDDEVSDITLRTLRELPVDALIAPTLEAPVTINRQLDLIRISSLSGKPLLTQVAGDIPRRPAPSTAGCRRRRDHSGRRQEAHRRHTKEH